MRKALTALFDLGYHTKHVDTIFKRVFGARPKMKTKPPLAAAAGRAGMMQNRRADDEDDDDLDDDED